MATADAGNLYADSTCITADGLIDCSQGGVGNNDGPMGPGFFIFFHSLGFGGGQSSRRRRSLPSAALQWRTAARIKRNLAYQRQQEIGEIITPRVVEAVTESVVQATNLKPIQRAYQIDEAAARRRLQEFIVDYIRQIEEDEIALLLILSEI